MTVEELRKEAEQLPEQERKTLIAELLSTIDLPVYDVTDDEVAGRVAELESGRVKEISYAEFNARVEHERKR